MAQVRLGEVDVEADRFSLGIDLNPRAALGYELHVTAWAESGCREVVAQVRIEQSLAGRNDRRCARREAADQLGFGGGDSLDCAQQLEMDRPDADDHADVGLGDARELGDLAGAAHPHLQDQDLGSGGCGEDLQGQPDLGVEVGPRGDRQPVRREHAEQQVLGRGLARSSLSRRSPSRRAVVRQAVASRCSAASGSSATRSAPSRE